MATLDMTNKVVVQNWTKEFSEAVAGTLALRDLIGDQYSTIYKPKSLTGRDGESTTVQLLYGGGKMVKGTVDTRLTSNNSTKFASDTVKLGTVAFPYDEGAAGRSIEATSVSIDLLDAMKNRGANDMQQWFTCSFFAQLAGVAVKNEAGEDCDGNNPLTAPTNTITGPMSLDTILDALTMAKKLRFQTVNGLSTGAKWVLYMSPTESAALRKQAAVDKNTWFDLSRALVFASSKGDLLSKDVLGEVYGVELRENIWCPEGKAFLLGGQSTLLQVGQGFDDLIQTHYEVLDGDIAHVKVKSVIGMKRTVYNKKDFGVVTINIAAATPPPAPPANGGKEGDKPAK